MVRDTDKLLTQIMPISFMDGLGRVTYICGQCHSELEQTYCSPQFKPMEHPGQAV
jgi:hypothetical protein